MLVAMPNSRRLNGSSVYDEDMDYSSRSKRIKLDMDESNRRYLILKQTQIWLLLAKETYDLGT